MSIQKEMAELLTQIGTALPKVTWVRDEEMERAPEAKQHKARAYTGQTDDWRFTLVIFDVGDGRRGAEGAAIGKKTPTVVRLPPTLAQRAADLAEKAAGG